MKLVPLIVGALALSGCSTMSESLQFGGGMGFASGALASYAGQSGAGSKPTLESVAAGAGIGLGIGLLAAYFTHQSVVEDRERYSSDESELHFGDLPPSPFLIPKPAKKKGGRRE